VINVVQEASWPIIGMTLEEAATAMRIDSRTLRTLIRLDGLPARKCGVGWRIDPDAVRRWLAERPAAAATAGAEEDE